MSEEQLIDGRSKTKGPHGIGDPNDKSLRRVERDVLIKNKVRAAARERCKEQILMFTQCAKEAGLKLPFQCRRENKIQIECLSKWFYDKELYEQMKEEYLKERTRYRETGIAEIKKKEKI